MALALLLALLVPPGQPYDEPAHHANAIYYAHEHRLPVLGEPGVHYEGQMGPGYYLPAAVLLSVSGTTEDPAAGLRLLRLAGVFLVPLVGGGTYLLARRLGAMRAPSLLAASAVAVNPTMLAVAGSVQNDYLSIAVGLVGALVALRAIRPSSAWWWSAAAGVVIGLAVLVKVFAGGLIVGLVVALLADRSRPLTARLVRGFSALVGAALVSGWWFVRNLRLYGDLTGASAVERTGVSFPPLQLDGLGSMIAWTGSLVSYAFAPTEYYRSAFDAPLPVKVLAVLLTACVVAAAVLPLLGDRRRRVVATAAQPEILFAATSVVIVVTVYAIAAWTRQAIAPRLVFVVAPLAAALVARACVGRRQLHILGLVVAGSLMLDVWLLSAVASVPTNPSLFPM